MTITQVDTTPKIYFLDLEVDHVPVDKGEPRRSITQIALYDPSREQGKRMFEAYVNPPKGLRHKEDTLSFNPEAPKKPRFEFSIVWTELKKWVNEGLDGDRFAVIVAHNIYAHDWPILGEECARIKEAIPKYWKAFDTLYLAGALGIPEGERSLSSLCQKYKINHLPQHVASNDVQMLANVFDKMREEAEMKKIANAMVLPPKEHPVREVANIIRGLQKSVMVFFDFESTGLFPKEGETGPIPRATELGAYIPSTNSKFTSFIDPGLDEGFTLSEKVTEITHITNDMIREAGIKYMKTTGQKMNFKAVWTDFEAWMEREIGDTVKKVIVLAGHNIWNYDLPLYKAECERFGMKSKFWKSMDTCVLSRSLYKGLKPQPKGFHSLDQIGQRLGIKNESAHRALGDVIANSKIWDCFVAGVSEETLNEAILSGHPIISVGQTIREEGGTFKAVNFMNIPGEQPQPVTVTQTKKVYSKAPLFNPAIVTAPIPQSNPIIINSPVSSVINPTVLKAPIVPTSIEQSTVFNPAFIQSTVINQTVVARQDKQPQQILSGKLKEATKAEVPSVLNFLDKRKQDDKINNAPVSLPLKKRKIRAEEETIKNNQPQEFTFKILLSIPQLNQKKDYESELESESITEPEDIIPVKKKQKIKYNAAQNKVEVINLTEDQQEPQDDNKEEQTQINNKHKFAFVMNK